YCTSRTYRTNLQSRAFGSSRAKHPSARVSASRCAVAETASSSSASVGHFVFDDAGLMDAGPSAKYRAAPMRTQAGPPASGSATSLTHQGRFVARRKLSGVSCRRIVIGRTEVPSVRASSLCAAEAMRPISDAAIEDAFGTVTEIPDDCGTTTGTGGTLTSDVISRPG